jgi:hypothetical protein
MKPFESAESQESVMDNKLKLFQLIFSWALLFAFLAFSIANQNAIFGRAVLSELALLSLPFALFVLGSILIRQVSEKKGTWAWTIYMVSFSVLYWFLHPIAQGWKPDFWGVRWTGIFALTAIGIFVNLIVVASSLLRQVNLRESDRSTG